MYVVTSGLLFPGKDRRKIKWHKNFLPAGPYWIFRPAKKIVFLLFIYLFIYLYIYIFMQLIID